MLSAATQAAHVVGGGGEGGGAGPPQASELSQSRHAQSTGLVHVAVASVQPVPNCPGL
jgi:hypothetical protein